MDEFGNEETSYETPQPGSLQPQQPSDATANAPEIEQDQEFEAQQRAEAYRRADEYAAQQEAQQRAQQEAQQQAEAFAAQQTAAQQEVQRRAQMEAHYRAQQEAHYRAQQEAQYRAQQEAQYRAQQEAQYRAQQEAQYRAQQEAQYRAQQEAYAAQQTAAQQQAANTTQQTARMRPAQPVTDGSAPVVATSKSVPAHAGRNAKKGSGTLKSLLVGLAGGAVSAAVVSLALAAAGITGRTSAPQTGDTTSNSAAGQTITINASTEDATIAQAAAAKALPSVVSVYVTTNEGSGLGSGAILDTDGNVITNYHVVEGANTVSVTIGGKSYDATVVGTDASSDLAVVHAELGGDAVTPIEVGDSDALVVGDWVMTIGSPFGLDQSVSAGIVSSLSRNQMMESYSGTTLYTNLIQTDASINPGNSGGALVNSQGQLVGINTLFSSDTESFAGIGFAIPGNYAIEVANKIIAGEQVTHAYIGLSMQTVNAQNAQQYHLSVNQGAYVAEVAAGSPAEAAGLQEGDIVIGLGDDEITSADGMILAVRSHKIGETTTVTFMRGTEKMTAEVTFADDAELQRLQQQEREQQQQQQEQGNGQEGMPNQYDPNGDDISYEEFIEWLLENNHGGTYESE